MTWIGLGRRVSDERDAGFTMMELVVAMLVLTVVLVLLAVVQISALATVVEAKKLQQATAFGNEAMEQMRAIPWNTLSKGMYSNFLAVSGGDPLVSGGNLIVDPSNPVPLIVAPAGNDQDLDNPARPLFDESGSHIQVLSDTALGGTEFTVKAYVVDASGGAAFGIVGIVVVVEWTDRHGNTARTTMQSEAYRGNATGCGDPDTQPFLAACQSYFDASAGTGSVTAEISATNYDLDPALIVPEPLTFPETSTKYSLAMRSAGVAARIRSQQVNYADGYIQFGGNTLDDNDPSIPAIQNGFKVYNLTATDDVTNQSGWLPDAAGGFSQSSADEPEQAFSHSAAPSSIAMRARSDYARYGTIEAHMDTSCMSGIPDGQPCVYAELDNNATDWSTGSGYLLLTVDSQIFRLSRRLSEGSPSPGNEESAWAARFASAPGTSAAVGCTSLTGPGCVSAGADRTMAPLNIGRVINSSWNGDAPEGMVVLSGYTESVMVQRGENQKDTGPTFSRTGTLNYWNGTGYTPVYINDTPASHMTSPEYYNTVPVTWTSGDYTIVAETQIQILPPVVTTAAPDPDCQDSACTVSVSTGTIVIVSTYHIAWTNHDHFFIVATTIKPPSAQASYVGAPS